MLLNLSPRSLVCRLFWLQDIERWTIRADPTTTNERDPPPPPPAAAAAAREFGIVAAVVDRGGGGSAQGECKKARENSPPAVW